MNRQKVRTLGTGFSRKKMTFLVSFPQEVSLHLLTCSIVWIRWIWVGLIPRTPSNSIWARRYSSSKYELVPNYYQITWNHMKSYCMEHRDFTNWTAVVDFEEVYLRAQMELEGVLGIKPTQIHQLSTLEQLWRSLDNSQKKWNQKRYFFLLIPRIKGFGRRTFCRFTAVD